MVNTNNALYYTVHTYTMSTHITANVSGTSLVMCDLAPGVLHTAVAAVNCAGISNVSVVGPYELISHGE